LPSAPLTGEQDAALSLAGRVIVHLSPVPDFDRLLSLDGALGRMTGVRNVTLADYAKEEVTFRVELESATPVSGFVQGLADAAGHQIEVVSADQDTVSLRLVA
jgi:hypothetical protein